MKDSGRVIRAVRRRLALVRLAERFQREAFYLTAIVLGAAALWRLVGSSPPAGPLLLAAAGLLVACGLFTALRTRISLRTAAAEADAVLGSEERISTALALASGRAEDPFGFRPVIEAEAARAAGDATSISIRKALPVRLRRRSLLSVLFLVGLFLVPLLPTKQEVAEAAESPAERKDKARVQEVLRRLDRKLSKTSTIAMDRNMKALEKLALMIRRQTAELADKRPTRAQAIARMGELERHARNAARRFAGLPRAKAGETRKVSDEQIKELQEAIRNFLREDPAKLLREFSSLMKKPGQARNDSARKEELERLSKALGALGDALSRLEKAMQQSGQKDSGQNGSNGNRSRGPGGRALENFMTPEQLRRMAKAVEALAKAMKNGKIPPSLMKKLGRNGNRYRDLEPTPQQIENMIRSMEQLAKMLEAGKDIRFTKGQLGGLGSLGVLGGLGGIGLGRNPNGPGQGASRKRGSGSNTGGPGNGNGGNPGSKPTNLTTRPEFDPTVLNPNGTATLFRTVRRLPSPSKAPRAYGELMRQASRQAEEAIRRGDIPRRYRDSVRRFFSGSSKR